MLSLSSLTGTSPADAARIADYPREEQAGRADDYYAAGGAPSAWAGSGAFAFGLAGSVDRQVVINAMQGMNPMGESLVQGAGPSRRYGTDLTFSCPKSVSCIWSVADESMRARIDQAQREAVTRTLAYIEQDFHLARRGRGGLEKESASLVAAVYEHGSSREGDPQRHSHVVLMNLGRRGDGTWGALDHSEIFKRKMELGAAYRAEMAAELGRMGFQVEVDGKDTFRIVGVPTEVEKEFSRRREQITAALAESGFSGGRAAEVAALNSRKGKELSDLDALRQNWLLRAAQHGLTPDLIESLHSPQQSTERPPFDAAKVLQELTWSRAVLSENDIKRASMVAAQFSGGGIAKGKELADQLKASGVRLRGLDGQA